MRKKKRSWGNVVRAIQLTKIRFHFLKDLQRLWWMVNSNCRIRISFLCLRLFHASGAVEKLITAGGVKPSFDFWLIASCWYGNNKWLVNCRQCVANYVQSRIGIHRIACFAPGRGQRWWAGRHLWSLYSMPMVIWVCRLCNTYILYLLSSLVSISDSNSILFLLFFSCFVRNQWYIPPRCEGMLILLSYLQLHSCTLFHDVSHLIFQSGTWNFPWLGFVILFHQFKYF